MKKLFVLLTALFTLAQVNAQEKNVIRLATDNTDLILQVAPNGRLYQAYLGDKLLNEKDINNFSPYVKGESSYLFHVNVFQSGKLMQYTFGGIIHTFIVLHKSSHQ